MNISHTRRAVVLGALLAPTFRVFSASKPVELVLGFPAGQSTDIVARALANSLSTELGQNMVVVNKPGQAGSIALASFVNAPADGSSITLASTAALFINPKLYKSVRYNTTRDLKPVALVYDGPQLLMVNADLPVNSVKELIEYVKARPGKLNFSSPGNGTVAHLAMSELARQAGLSLVHVPYQGSAQSLTDLAAGVVDITIDGLAASQPYLTSKRIKPLAVTSADRMPRMPDVPSLSESGFPGFDLVPWAGMFVPAGTPDDVVEELSRGIKTVLDTPEFTARMDALGTRKRYLAPSQFQEFLATQDAGWAEAVASSGIKVD